MACNLVHDETNDSRQNVAHANVGSASATYISALVPVVV